MVEKFKVSVVETIPYFDQNPGTSGLRRKCGIYTQENYTENFIQSILLNIPEETRSEGCLIVGGDGRFYSKEAANLCVQMAAANKFKKVILCRKALGSTPAISHMIRLYKATGAIILTASHNPGGLDEDFGMKYNTDSGGGAPQSVTQAIFEASKTLIKYKIARELIPNMDTIGVVKYEIIHLDGSTKDFEVETIDSVKDYVEYMKKIFDFSLIENFIKKGFAGKPLKINIDSRNGISGIYCTEIFVNQMGLPESNLSNATPLPDFGGLHPDPNLTYAADFIENVKKNDCDFGAAFDGDADRCMVVGKNGYYISPSDSIAIIAANAMLCIPFFRNRGYLNGVARSMPTSSAIDKVAELLSIQNGREFKCYEVPTGWKFFCNLMDDKKVDICGEESFGGGSCHLREKDGVWVCLAWLSVMAHFNKPVNEIISDHWRKFGRHFYTRYDYENLTEEQGNRVLQTIDDHIASGLKGKVYKIQEKETEIVKADNFTYEDPVDHSIATKQGYRIIFQNSDRIIVRLSGTGSQGATIRVYMEHYETDAEKMFIDTQESMKDLINIALELTKMREITKRDSPTVIS